MRLRVLAALSLTIFMAAGVPAASQAATPAAAATAAASTPLQLAGSTDLPSYKGDFDHFAADVAGNRLFLAGEDGATLEVFDLANGKHLRTVTGFDQPHSPLFMHDLNRLMVTDSGKGMTRLVDAANYRIIGSIPLVEGADPMLYDPSTRRAYIVSVGKNAEPPLPNTVVSAVDPRTGKKLGEITFDTPRVESMAVEEHGKRLFVNLTGKNTVAVLDKKTLKVLDNWPVQGAELNAAMAYDEAHQRLFVGTRQPFKLLVLDATNGKTIASFDAPQRTDQVLFDKANQRVYLAGDGYLQVIQQKDPNHYEDIAHVTTATGAKTAVLVPERHELFVAVSPGDANTGGKLLRFDVMPGGKN
jgi:DNA-binding beta-propeller fold protein YncE